MEHAVGRPLRLKHRLAASAGDLAERGDRAVGRQVGHPQLALVPGHVRMVPCQPRQPGAVGAHRRVAVEVAAGHQHLAGATGRQIQRDDGVDRFAPRVAVVLADAHQAAQRAVHHAVAVAQVHALGSDGHRRRARLLPVEPLVGEVREPHHAVRDPEAQPAVLVHPRAHVERRRRHVPRRAVRCAPHDYVAPALGGPHLRPVDVVAVELDRAELHRVLDDQIGGDRRLPRSVRCCSRHVPDVARFTCHVTPAAGSTAGRAGTPPSARARGWPRTWRSSRGA